MAEIANNAKLIWDVAELLRGDYKRSEYGRVVQPLVVLRRLDQMMEPTRDAVIAAHTRRRAQHLAPEALEQVLSVTAGRPFFNVSPLRLHQLLDDPPRLRDNMLAYLHGGRASIPGTVADLLATGLLQAGAKLRIVRAHRSGQAVVNTAGQLVVDGVAYDSPSTAGKMALGVRSVNGWTAWSLEDGSGRTLGGLRGQWQDRQVRP